MRLLLDTQIFLWWLTDDGRLGHGPRQAITDPGNTVHVSPATIWELAIKSEAGRLDLAELDPVAELASQGFTELTIRAVHAWRAGGLPLHHKDPFDRMLVAQADHEQLVLITADEVLAAYGVPIMLGR